MLEEIVTEGAKKSLLSPVKKVPRKSLLSPVKKGAGTSGSKISDMFPDPSRGPCKLTKEVVDQMSMKEFLKAKEWPLVTGESNADVFR